MGVPVRIQTNAGTTDPWNGRDLTVLARCDYGQSDTGNYEGELVTDYWPVLVYLTPHMTDEQAKAIQDFVDRVMNDESA